MAQNDVKKPDEQEDGQIKSEQLLEEQPQTVSENDNVGKPKPASESAKNSK